MFNWPDFVTSIFGGATSSLVVVYGLSRWLGDTWKARILEGVQQENRKELEALKSEMQGSVDKANRLLDAGISKAILVTRTHFETEFTAYKEIFAALSDLNHCIQATRPMIIMTGDEMMDEGTQNQALLERLNKLIEAHNKTVTLSANLSPFYYEEIYRAVEKCFNVSKLEIFQVKTGGRNSFTSEWFDQGHGRQSEFMEGYAQVAKLIRERLASLGVLPE
jgi:hypothetical protein